MPTIVAHRAEASHLHDLLCDGFEGVLPGAVPPGKKKKTVFFTGQPGDSPACQIDLVRSKNQCCLFPPTTERPSHVLEVKPTF